MGYIISLAILAVVVFLGRLRDRYMSGRDDTNVR